MPKKPAAATLPPGAGDLRDGTTDDTSTSAMRKIELSSAEDIRHLIKLVSGATDTILSRHMPDLGGSSTPPPSDTDSLRAAVAAHVHSYINTVFSFAAPSISVNGLDASNTPIEVYTAPRESVEEFETYDRALHNEVTELYARIEKATVEVTRMRREVPARLTKAYQVELEREERRDENRVRKIHENEHEHEEEEGKEEGEDEEKKKRRERRKRDRENPLGVIYLDRERARGAAETRKRALAGLDELGRSLPAAAHKLTRAGEALDYVLHKQAKATTTTTTTITDDAMEVDS